MRHLRKIGIRLLQIYLFSLSWQEKLKNVFNFNFRQWRECYPPLPLPPMAGVGGRATLIFFSMAAPDLGGIEGENSLMRRQKSKTLPKIKELCHFLLSDRVGQVGREAESPTEGRGKCPNTPPWCRHSSFLHVRWLSLKCLLIFSLTLVLTIKRTVNSVQFT